MDMLKMGDVTVLVLAAVLVMAYLAFRTGTAISQGYSWNEMDWDRDGTTSLMEFFAGSDVGKREEMREGRKCLEYFRIKDGLSIRVDCATK